MSDPLEATPVVEACPSCATLIDVSGEAPLADIFCPSCGQAMKARQVFNNFRLEALIGQGGMGSVFRAVDVNLNRLVALKILRLEISGSASEREKLAEEAQRTAAINHPHVVKVFNFGEDRGQFYLAMELVEKGSLDDLMTLQRRVAEMQILEVGAQIAGGLQAALEAGLIHRDIKPGNILFADAHTAKLVDFGLALVADEAAVARGEVWGTPYYIAPEKLDQQPEDFRSDIYSLGGTLFHALAGRPPYEAETASMVALKQLKSQPVSLQAFAPDVSSETAYVINRMLEKDPDNRYQSYEELVGHLGYAREKLQARLSRPRQVGAQKPQVENRSHRMALGLISLGMLVLLLVLLGVVYWERDRLAVAMGISREASSGEVLPSLRAEAIAAANDGDPARAAQIFRDYLSLPDLSQPEENWARLQLMAFLYLAGEGKEVRSVIKPISQDGLFSEKPEDLQEANFFLEMERLLGERARQLPNPSMLEVFDPNSLEAFAWLLFGLANWQDGQLGAGGETLSAFSQVKPPPDFAWILNYQPLVQRHLEEYTIWRGLADRMRASGADDASLLDEVRSAKSEYATDSPTQAAWDELEAQAEALAPR
jgi:eukaryotic-like serine/threonine-protein kinase